MHDSDIIGDNIRFSPIDSVCEPALFQVHVLVLENRKKPYSAVVNDTVPFWLVTFTSGIQKALAAKVISPVLDPAICTVFAPKKGRPDFPVNVNVFGPVVCCRPDPGITSSNDIAPMVIVKFVGVVIFIKLVAVVPAPVKCNVPLISISRTVVPVDVILGTQTSMADNEPAFIFNGEVK